jgi:predicted nuclease of predicted toxin-antitoxin system
VRFLVDENISRRIVEGLIAAGHDAEWVVETRSGDSDPELLEASFAKSQLLLTADRDFGELTVRFGLPAFGVVIVAMDQFRGNPEKTAQDVIGRVTELGDSLIGFLTMLEPGRTRRRALSSLSHEGADT